MLLQLKSNTTVLNIFFRLELCVKELGVTGYGSPVTEHFSVNGLNWWLLVHKYWSIVH